MAVAREFQVMVKPVGPVCNLACRYCYYVGKESLWPAGEPFRMPHELLESYVVQHLEASPAPVVHFQWHGGEPTIAGLDYFRTAVEFQRRHCPPERRVTNGLQTNGVLLDEAWCRFLATEGFYVGLSLDGPEDLHDGYRRARGGRPTHRDAVRAWELLERHGVPTDVLCVVHDRNAEHPARVYRFFKDLGVRHLQFLPLVERAGGDPRPSERSVTPEALGRFLVRIFDEWVRHDIGRIVIQTFDEAARPACGLPHALCIFSETCGRVPVVEHDGGFYACDHFVDAAHRLGDVRETPLGVLLESESQRAFGDAKRDTLPRVCRECDVLAMCNGGCPKDRFARTPDGGEGLNYLCAGFQRFFRHTRPYWEELAALWRAGQPLERLMLRARARDPVAGNVGRNDPCPCGSGRKHKRCCGR